MVAPKRWGGKVQERGEQSDIECVGQQLNGCLRRMNFSCTRVVENEKSWICAGSIIKTAPSPKKSTSCRMEKRSKDSPPFDAACGGLKNTTSHENRVCIFCETKHKQKDPRGRVAVHGCIIIDAIINTNLHCGRTRCKRSAVARVCLLYLCLCGSDFYRAVLAFPGRRPLTAYTKKNRDEVLFTQLATCNELPDTSLITITSEQI